MAIVTALTNRMHDEADIVKFTVGQFSVIPSAPSVVASAVIFSIDLRHPDSATLQLLGDAIAGICEAHAGSCGVQLQELSTALSLEFPASIRNHIRDVAGRLGLSHIDLHSAAGHDARYLHAVCPTGMLFIPCHLGITHNEAESISAKDATAGARVLTDVLAELAL